MNRKSDAYAQADVELSGRCLGLLARGTGGPGDGAGRSSSDHQCRGSQAQEPAEPATPRRSMRAAKYI